MKAIIIPGINDLNKGGQALIWESVNLVKDLGLYDTVKVLSNGDTSEEMEKLCGQSRMKGVKLLYNILRHPRRGRHEDDFQEGFQSRLRLSINALKDFLSLNFLKINLNRPVLLSAFFDQNVMHTLKEFKDADTIFVKGGGFIHAYGEYTASYQMWYFLFYIRLAYKLGKKVVVLPNSFGPFDGIMVKSQVKKVLLKADIIFAREKESAKQLEALLNRKISVFPDLGFYLKSETEKRLLNHIPEKFHSDKNVKVGFTVRPWRFPGKSDRANLYENYLIAVTELVKEITAKGYVALFFNQSLGPNTHEDDRIAVAEIMKRLQGNENVYWIDENFSCDELQVLYSGLDYMVGTRFHSVIFSMNSSVPSLAIGYGGNKANGIMGDFGLDDYTVPIDVISYEDLSASFRKLVTNRDEITSQLMEFRSQLSDSRSVMIDFIKNQLK